jgi:PII-like signaling protein
MDIQTEAKILRIFISSTDKFKHKPLSQIIVYLAKRNGLTGATVFRGTMGYGPSSKYIYQPTNWEVVDKTPMVIEIVDDAVKIEAFVKLLKPYLDLIRTGCLITCEHADVLFYKKGEEKKPFFNL